MADLWSSGHRVKTPEDESFLAFGREKEVKILLLFLRRANSLNNRCTRCIALRLRITSKLYSSDRVIIPGITVRLHTKKEPECGPMPNVMATLPNIGGALCSTPQSLANAQY